MNVRVRQTIKLAPGVRLNMRGNGATLSLGPAGAALDFVMTTPGGKAASETAPKGGVLATLAAYQNWGFGAAFPPAPEKRRKTRKRIFWLAAIGIFSPFLGGLSELFIIAGLIIIPVAAILYLDLRGKETRDREKHGNEVRDLRLAHLLLAHDQLTALVYFAKMDNRMDRAERDIITDYALGNSIIPPNAAGDFDAALRKMTDPGTPAFRDALVRLSQYASEELRQDLFRALENLVSTGKMTEAARNALETAKAGLGL